MSRGKPVVYCDSAELLVDLKIALHAIQFDAHVELVEHARCPRDAEPDTVCALLTAERIEPASLVRLVEAKSAPAVLHSLQAQAEDCAVAADLGIVCTPSLRSMLVALCMLHAGIDKPWIASTRKLKKADRLRLSSLLSQRPDANFVRMDEGLIGWQRDETAAPLPLGFADDVGAALFAMYHAQDLGRPKIAEVRDVQQQTVRDLLLGPPRALSDPTSKSILAQYDVPLPEEELCGSPSRAASEAMRFGFPVRIALASPDLRLWDHPDLIAFQVSNATAARDAYRQLMAIAAQRAPDARILGVTVRPDATYRALLEVQLEPVARDLVLARIGFADPHGIASEDFTRTILPTSARGLERSLERLRGHSLLFPAAPTERKTLITELGDTLLRLSALVHDRANEIAELHVRPLIVTLDHRVMVGEACIRVSDAFVREQRAAQR